MYISNLAETKTLWEGSLETPGGARRDLEGVSASIGEPFQWAEGELLGEKWKPPLGAQRFYLLQLAFTLRPSDNLKVTSADFSLSLGSQSGSRALVFDAFPREQSVEQNNSVTLGLGPDFKFGVTDVSLARAETQIDFGQVIPVVRVEGLQESRLRWRYSEHAKYPLSGSRRMLAIIALPPEMKTVLAKFALEVTAVDRVGRLFLAPPEYDSEKLRFVIGQKGE